MAPHFDHEPNTTSNTKDVDVPILIVGGGPTGLLLAHMLSKLGGETKFKCIILC
jgi:NADPH-dependent 2,4-dienoyl-CoA reductase/sulfur reductase-like enzyme